MMLISLVQARALVLSIFSQPCCIRQQTTSPALEGERDGVMGEDSHDSHMTYI